MEKLERIGVLIMQVVMMFLLFETLKFGSIGALLGTGFGVIGNIMISFGITAMSIMPILISLFHPSVRQRLLKYAQGNITSYLFSLLFFQIIFVLMGMGISHFNLTVGKDLSPMLQSVMMMIYIGTILYTPFNYLKHTLNEVKGIEFRRPRSIMKQYKEL